MEDLRILVPLDGSPEAESALSLAAPLFRARPARLTLFRVTPPDGPSAEAVEYLSRARDALLRNGVTAEIRAEWGQPAEEILWLARTGRFDLITMTTHGRGGVRRLFGGSVAEAVVRGSDLPVLLNRPGQPARGVERIVVPLDGSALAEKILPDALRMAKLLGAELHVVQATLPPLLLGSDGGIPYLPPPDPTPYLRGVCEKAAGEGVRSRLVPLVGPAASEIARYAEAAGAGMICMTTHGRTGLARALLGSTAEQVLRSAPCPVLVRRALKASTPAEAVEAGSRAAP